MAQMNRSLVSLFPLQNTTYSPLPCMIVEEHTKCLRKCANDAFPILIDRVLKMKETLFCLYSGRGWIVSLSLSMDLQDFLIRARVLRLYRQALRIAGRAPSSAKAELRQTIRQEMENNRNCNDKQRIRFLISEGLDKLKRLDEMLDMQGYR
ncbi:uncharacterized protein [Glycine max]|nr:uncharacterized protein LOC100782536 isoform X1 [Glycine max]